MDDLITMMQDMSMLLWMIVQTVFLFATLPIWIIPFLIYKISKK